MINTLEAAKLKAETTYNAAADHYEATPLAFWGRYGQRTIERAALRRGESVLDVCCGAGASALPAAKAVGLDGKVVAVDLAEKMLKLGRAKAELWRLVRPGGRLVIATWGPGIFAPAYEIWLAAIHRVRPDLYSAFNPWDRITTPEAVRRLFVDAGIARVDVVPEEGHQTLRVPEDFWTIALGSGLRWTIDQMGVDVAREVKQEILGALAAKRIERVGTNVIYAVARRHDVV